MAEESIKSKGVYVFDLHLLCGGYAYFSTLTLWQKTGDHGREWRKPSVASMTNFANTLNLLGQNALMLTNQSEYQYWLAHRGWGVVSQELAREIMPQWLKAKLCITSAACTFTDTDLCSPNALNHHASGGKRTFVIERDGGRCLLCGKTQDHKADLTMQHIIPFSSGGETTIRNLVTLCSQCNESLGAKQYQFLYELAGLPHGLDLGLFGAAKPSDENIHHAQHLSSNLMHTRCEVW